MVTIHLCPKDRNNPTYISEQVYRSIDLLLPGSREDLNEMTGNASGGLFSFILDTFRLEPINFNLKLLQDKEPHMPV